ncbi:MAG: hypothetical protein VYC34_03755 [Planctomycetota bacterium]|nr:hypothetical protein [Planctomycetota bacterium]
MSSMLLAAAVLSSALAAPYDDAPFTRDALLLTPAPYPPNSIISVHRPENGRLWIPRSPIGSRTPQSELVYYDRGPAYYGAPAEALNDLILVDVVHVPIAISPWERFELEGFEKYHRAQHLWLKEQGLIQKVRTHVNPKRLRQPAGMYSQEAPTPRATIRLHDEMLRRPSEMRVMGPVSGQPITRISRPHALPAPGPAFTVAPVQGEETLAEASQESAE